MRSSIVVAVLLISARCAAASDDPQASPLEWAVDLTARLPEGFRPRSLAVGPDEVLFIGGAGGTILKMSGEGVQTFADHLGPVAGLEWTRGALFAVHGSTLSSLRGPEGPRADLVRGLGVPSGPGEPEGLGAGSIRRGMDGFLYIAVGDRGIPAAKGRGGEPLRMPGAGVVRVRPDGSDLEIVSTGDARPGGLALTRSDDVFTFSSTEDARWALRLVQHIPGGRYGYPYQFLTSGFRTLPPTAKLAPGRAGQAVFLDVDSTPQADLISCEPDAGSIVSQSLRKQGGAFVLKRRGPIQLRGDLNIVRPIALASRGFHLWALDADGRVFRMTCVDAHATSVDSRPGAPGLSPSVEERIALLDSSARSTRLEAQDRLASDPQAVDALAERLTRRGSEEGRWHALWALDAMGGDLARTAIRARLGDEANSVRLQAARSCGLRRDVAARDGLVLILVDRDPAVRREAAIALGRLTDRTVVPALLAALGDSDPFAAWAIRHALLDLGCSDPAGLRTALKDPRRRESALLLADESWSVPIVEALADVLGETDEPAVRSRMIACLAGQFRRYPAWTGEWFGPTPLSGSLPKKTEAWDSKGMAAVLRGLERGLKDTDASVRYQAALGLQPVGPSAGPMLREALTVEADADAQAAIVEALGAVNDAPSTRVLLPIVVDPNRPEEVRSAALDSLNQLRGRDVVRARLTVLYEERAPESLVAKALPALARDGFLPPNDLAGFLDHASPLVRAAALLSLSPSKPLPGEIKGIVLARFDDEDSDVRRAAFLASGPLKLREAVPRLVEKAMADDDRAVAIAALCSIPDPRALPIYVDALDDTDPSIRRGALAALLAIRDGSEPELRRIAADKGRTPNATLALRRVLARFEDLQKWSILGPLAVLPADWLGPDGAVDAERTIASGAETVRWTPTLASKAGVVDLVGIGQVNRPVVAGGYAEIVAGTPREGILLVEADAPIEVSLNGQRLEPASASGGMAGDYFRIELAAGVNRLAVVSRPGPSSWRFAASISSADSERP